MSLKNKLKMVFGAIALGAFGASSAYWIKETRDYNSLISHLDENFDNVAIVGDTGQIGNIRESVIKKIKELRPTYLILPGDLKYPDAIKSLNDFTVYVGPFLGPWKTIVTLGNHGQYGNKGWMQENADKNGVEWKNYYHGKIFKNACVGFAESSVYDVALGSPEIENDKKNF